MSYVQFLDGEVVSVRIPNVGVLPDGRRVSNFDKLPENVLNNMGWYQSVEHPIEPPDGYDFSGYEDILNGNIVTRYPNYIPTPVKPVEPNVTTKEQAQDLLLLKVLHELVAKDELTYELAEEVHILLPELNLDGALVQVGELYSWMETVVEVVQEHTTSVLWDPIASPSLFKIFRNASSPNSPDEWVRPAGAHDAYSSGAFVTYNGQVWLNTHGDGNIWAPDEYGWALYEP